VKGVLGEFIAALIRSIVSGLTRRRRRSHVARRTSASRQKNITRSTGKTARAARRINRRSR